MTMLTLYGLKSCDTCRKALKSLREAGHDVTLHDVRAERLERAQVERFHADLGDMLINRSSTTWRALDTTERDGDPVALIVAHPALMKRPVIDDGTRLYLGWKTEVQQALI